VNPAARASSKRFESFPETNLKSKKAAASIQTENLSKKQTNSGLISDQLKSTHMKKNNKTKLKIDHNNLAEKVWPLQLTKKIKQNNTNRMGTHLRLTLNHSLKGRKNNPQPQQPPQMQGHSSNQLSPPNPQP
jgi:hypothetical protein